MASQFSSNWINDRRFDDVPTPNEQLARDNGCLYQLSTESPRHLPELFNPNGVLFPQELAVEQISPPRNPLDDSPPFGFFREDLQFYHHANAATWVSNLWVDPNVSQAELQRPAGDYSHVNQTQLYGILNSRNVGPPNELSVEVVRHSIFADIWACNNDDEDTISQSSADGLSTKSLPRGRTRPLPADKRQKVAAVRQAGACARCRIRRVGVRKSLS